MPKIYMDYAATTPLDGKVLEAMLPYLTNVHGNPSSLHFTGREAREALDESREKVARALGADPEEIIFTSGGTEANNMAIQGASRAFKKALSPGERGHIITSSIEHHAVLDTVNYLGNTGFDVTFLPVDEYGLIDPEELAEHITDKTFLVTIMTANNEIGTIQPFEEIGRVCRENGVYFHTDAVQAIGHIPFNLKEQPVDMLSLSAHKFYGPKGVGVLYLRKHTKIEQAFFGGAQEKGLRPGTENLPGIVGLGRAIELATADMEEKSIRLTVLRDRLIKGLLEIEDVKLNGHPRKRLPGNVNVSVLYIEGESLLLSLDLKGIAVSSGSACTSGSPEPSHVLSAIGLDHQAARGSVRLSLGKDSTVQEIDYTVEAIKEITARLRKMSSVYKKQSFL
ncbi:MAG: cysteine desulfurase NifS [Firmicutes bacterium]|nr:cysteine desulfurase NifS [Bacillota bacterium]